MNFKEWFYKLNEVGTSTSCVALFQRPIFGGSSEELRRRRWPPLITFDTDGNVKYGAQKEQKNN